MPPKADVKGLLVELLNESSVQKKLASALADALMPHILERLKELNEFNSEFSNEFDEYKKTSDERIKKWSGRLR
jgi:hypothetical protein